MRRVTRSALTPLVALIVLALDIGGPSRVIVSGQAGAGRPAPSRLAVDFCAVRADGFPVEDLQPGEVEIRLNGRVRKVLALGRVTAAPARPELPGDAARAARLPAAFATNEGVAAGRSFVILVDELSFVAGRESLLRNSVEGLLAHLTPADRTMVLALPYGGVKAPFTADAERIRQAMAALIGQGERGESGSGMAERTRTFLETLQAFLHGQAGRRTPLTVILFTAGLAAPRRDAPMALPPGRGELLVDHFKWIGETAGAARANFYVIQPADIKVDAAGWKETIGGRDYLGSDNPLEGIEHLAGVSNAVRLPLDAKGTASLDRVALESSAYFVADLEPEAREVVGRSRPLDVRVNRPGVTVRSRPQVTFPDTGRRSALSALEDALLSGDVFNDLPVRAATFVVRESDDRLRAGILLEPAGRDVSLAAAAAVLIQPGGRIAARWTAADASRQPLLGALAAVPGTYTVRVAAMDTAGRLGAVDQPVELQLVPVGPLALGSLMLGVSRPEGLVPQLQFGAEPAAIASFEIYGGTPGLGLSATLELARTLEGPALVKLPLTLSAVGEGRVAATATVPIGALPSGDYVVRGVISLEDGTTGQVSCTLRKAPG